MNMRSSLHHILSAILLAAALCGCSRSVLEHNKSVAVSAVFSDNDDFGAEVSDLKLQFYNSNSGELVLQDSFATAEELALKLFSVPSGAYTVVLGANIASPVSLGGENTLSGLHYSVDGASSRQAFSARSDFSVDVLTRVVEVKMDMSPFLCEFAIEIEGAPDGLELEMEETGSAEAFYPAQMDEDGNFGTLSESARPAVIPAFTLSAASPRSRNFILMPTALGKQWSFWQISMKAPGGIKMDSYIEAPRMNPGGKYLISLVYEKIQSFMHLSPCTIDDWTQGWVYDGAIENPVNTNN